MLGIIDNYNFKDMENMKYWAPPSSWGDEKKKEKTRSRIFSGEWIAAEKKDGYFSKFIKDDEGNIMLLSRNKNVNGEYPNKYEWVPQLEDFFKKIPNGSCLLGELYLPSSPGSSNVTKLLGCVKDKCIKRQKENEYLHFYIFDVLAWNGISFMNKDNEYRAKFASSLQEILNFKDEFVEYPIFYDGAKLWNKLQMILANGGEGMVILRKAAKYQPGKRPSADCQKVKKELAENIDCFFTGKWTKPVREYTGKEIETWKYWENIRTGEKIYGEKFKEYSIGSPIEPITKSYYYNWAGSLEIGVIKKDENNNSTIFPIGLLSGLSEEIKSDPLKVKYKCIEVAAMEILPTGGIRHGKLKQFREDLTKEDCTWDKYMRG